MSLGSTLLIIILGLIAFFICAIIYVFRKETRRAANAERFYRENPDVSTIYIAESNQKNTWGRPRIGIEKVDGNKPVAIANGVYVLPGQRNLTLYDDDSTGRRPVFHKVPSIIVEIEKGKDYFLLYDEVTRVARVERKIEK